jgi:hypothetical protein
MILCFRLGMAVGSGGAKNIFHVMKLPVNAPNRIQFHIMNNTEFFLLYRHYFHNTHSSYRYEKITSPEDIRKELFT